MAEMEEVSPKGRPILEESFVDRLVDIPKYIPKEIKDPFRLKEDNGHLRSSVALICDCP